MTDAMEDVERIRDKRIYSECRLEKLKEKDRLQDVEVDGMVIFKRFLNQ
jgi:hypothetical protein